MTLKALYTEGLKWWKNKKHQNQTPTHHDNFDTSVELTASDIDSVSSDLSDENNSEDIFFSLILSYNVWETIQPVAKEYKRNEKSHKSNSRTYYVLESGLWTSVLVDRIAQNQQDIICTWAFKNAKVYINGEKYINLKANCTTCGAILIGFVAQKPNEGENVKFQFKIQNFNADKHAEGRKNVRIGGSIAKELFTSKKSASVLKKEMISKSGAKMFEEPKGREVSENAIRAGQCRNRQADKLFTSPLLALEYLKGTNAYGPSIHMTGLSPFFAMYAGNNQFALFDAYRKANKNTKICCDATGGLVHKISK